MFGFLIGALDRMTQEQHDRYRECYCGLCRSLRERHGRLARMTLNYDMTFLVLLLSSLYEPEERRGEDACAAHPFRGRSWWSSEATGYAADMNVALACLKCRDNWDDDANIVSLAEAGLLKAAYDGVCARYPRQCGAMRASMDALHAIESSGADDPDAAAETFGALMGEVLVLREDRWAGELRAMGRALGRFLYVADACVDLDSDTLYNRYNPFRRYYGLPDNEQRFRDILEMILGECLLHFDRLPLVQDADILKNILCVGLWAQFDRKFSDKKGPSDDSGSV
ncbi:MAG: DUF5685 family protein [Oscillospiraceae bacterium]|nr:DUF5685 family protein [Oscillospiraceae bacterium]